MPLGGLSAEAGAGERVLPLEGGDIMLDNDDENRLSGNEKEERDPLLHRALSLVPLLDLILRALELLLKALGVIE
jgi:hypothetical protein